MQVPEGLPENSPAFQRREMFPRRPVPKRRLSYCHRMRAVLNVMLRSTATLFNRPFGTYSTRNSVAVPPRRDRATFKRSFGTGIRRKPHRITGLIGIGVFTLIVHQTATAAAPSADDFFHSGARSYLSNNVAGARKEVDQGLKLFPDDIKLKKLDELLKQQQQQQQNQQQQQQQQNQSQQNQSKQNQQQQQQQQKQNEQQKQQEQSKQQQEQQKQAEQQKEQEQKQAQAREMTPDQAKQLMDQEKADETLLPASRKEKPRNQEHPLKDW